MKEIPIQKQETLSKDEALKLINEIYKEPSTTFDDACILSVTIEFTKGKSFVTYDKICVKTKDGHLAYWPIKPFDEEVKDGLSFIKRKLNAT